MTSITVQLGPQSYSIVIDSSILAGIGEQCRAVGLAGRAAVVTNPTVAALYAETVLGSLTAAGYQPLLVEVPDGEAYKTSETLNMVYDRLIDGGLDRRCFVVALGGGVVGDLAGFAAATFMRGIPFVQVPTTLLAQVDSSVGGKTGVDHHRGKNLIGAFHQPRLVLADVATLATLPEREYRAGLAEVVKYGVVLDHSFFELLEQHVAGLLARDQQLINIVVARCCSLKAWVVEQDEREGGVRAVLNYGHTLGHAFEALAGYEGLVHGEAVSIGMALAASISAAEGLCTKAECDRIVSLLNALELPTATPAVSRDALVAALSQDKKSRAGVIQYICNQGIGAYALRDFTPAQLAENCVAGR